MSEQTFGYMVVLFGAGIGLMLVGATHFFLGARSLAVRAPVLIGCAGSAALLPALLISSTQAIAAATITLGALAVMATVGSHRFGAGLQAISRFLCKPIGQGSVLCLAGIGLMLGSYVHFFNAEEASVDDDMAFMTELLANPPLTPANAPSLMTDAGNEIAIRSPEQVRARGEVESIERRLLVSAGYSERVIRVAPASDVSNCHGWVFTGGKYWISPEAVAQILNDNGYQPVSDPRPGDLTVYRNSGSIAHTAVVRANNSEAGILVEGKWGWMGVFLHRVGDSCYGKEYTFYRGPRDGHHLVAASRPEGQPTRGNSNTP